MKIGTIAIAAGTLALGLAVWTTPGKAQGPLYDRVEVNLPYTVTIGSHTLQPGDYVIQQLRDTSGDSRTLLIYSDNGMHFKTSAMTIPAYSLAVPEHTSVILHHFGNDYYFDRIWIQGKNYGYEFPLPNSVKEREKERMQPISVAATYSAVPPPTQTAQAAPPPAEQPAPAPPPAEAPAPAPAPPPAAAPAPPPPQAERTMPTTDASWLMMLLSGGALSGAGLMLRRKR